MRAVRWLRRWLCGITGTGMLRARPAEHLHAARDQQLPEEMSGELGRVFDGKLFAGGLGIDGKGTPQDDGVGTGIAADADVLYRPGSRGEDAVLDLVVVGVRVDLEQGLVACLCARIDIEEQNVVVHTESRDRRSVVPLQIVARPAFGEFE